MKIPSVTTVLREAQRSFLRFPLVLLDAFVGSYAAIVLIEYEETVRSTVYFPIFLGAVLGFPLVAAIALTAEKYKWTFSRSIAAQGAGLLLAAAYALSIPQEYVNMPAYHAIRHALLTAGFTLLALVGPYVLTENVTGFWQYCRAIFERLVVSFLYGCILWVGLALALAALDNLFGVDVPGRRYGELWTLIQGVFTPWFFLAGLPEDFESLDRPIDYPRGLRIFSQYILFPLVLTYLAILYVYLGKIIISWDWPQGWVSKLILSFVGTGLFSMMLLHPIKEQSENKWIRTSARWFFFVIIPLVVMLFFAVWRRVSEYGFTEGRYLALALGMWLCGIILYFIISRKKNIIVIPASLALVAFLVSFGSWGAIAVSERSQVTRLKEILEQNKILVNGTVQSSHDSVSDESRRQISAILSYLHDIHGFDGIQPWFTESLRADSSGTGGIFRDAPSVAKLMGIEYVRGWRNVAEGFIVLLADRDSPRDVNGYERMVRARPFAKERLESVTEGDLRYRMDPGMYFLDFSVKTEGGKYDSVRIDFTDLVSRLMKKYGDDYNENVPPEEMAVSSVGPRLKLQINLWHLSVDRRGEQLSPVYYEVDILFTILKEDQLKPQPLGQKKRN